MVCVGIITQARGLKGEVRIRAFTQTPEAVAAYGPVTDETGSARWTLGIVKGEGESVVARIEGVADRTQAKALKGTRLYVRRDALPEPDDDEYYHVDLIGLTADLGEDAERAVPFGRVAFVHDFGAGPILEIERTQGPPVLVPFTRDAVPVVDLTAGRIRVAPLPGLFETDNGSAARADGNGE
jgi:16S rRNA processing protein RimM